MASLEASQHLTGLRGLLARYLLTAYFLIALIISWLVVITWVVTDWPVTFWTIVGITAGPFLASFIMTWLTQGGAGVRLLIARIVRWRVPAIWYAVALLGIPLIMILGMVPMPGAVQSFDPLTAATWAGYPWMYFLVTFLGGPFLEEPGWRGFALSRMQRKFGPLVATLLLGVLWAAWHYPQYMMPSWAAQNGGFTLSSVLVYTLSVIPLTVILTWVFNNTRGSLLLAILTHASINTFFVYVVQMFPAQAESQVFGFVGFGGAALLIILLTRGRLGYDRYLRETTSFERGETSAA